MKVLLIDNDITTVSSIELALKVKGFNVYTTDLGEEGLELALRYDYDIILLELNLADMTGYQFLRHLRLNKNSTPVMVVSYLNDSETKVKALDLGADDFVDKPFDSDELAARARTLIRRSKGYTASVIKVGDLEIDLRAKRVKSPSGMIHMTNIEYQLIELLALRFGSAITKEIIFDNLYGGIDEPSDNNISVYICKLRKKIREATGGHNYIDTLWGRGYIMIDPTSKKSTSMQAA